TAQIAITRTRGVSTRSAWRRPTMAAGGRATARAPTSKNWHRRHRRAPIQLRPLHSVHTRNAPAHRRSGRPLPALSSILLPRAAPWAAALVLPLGQRLFGGGPLRLAVLLQDGCSGRHTPLRPVSGGHVPSTRELHFVRRPRIPAS